MAKRIALVGIIVEDSAAAERINSVLHDYGENIIGRMGLPYRQRGVHVISVVMDAENDVISSMAGKIGKIPGVSVKTVYQKETPNVC